MDNCDDNEKPPNPRASCNILSAFTFIWTRNLFFIGNRREIQITDVYKPLNEHASGILGSSFSEYYELKQNSGNTKLYKILFGYFWRENLTYFSISFIRECVLRVAQPLFLGVFISYYVPGQELITWEVSCQAAVYLVICSLLYTLLTHPCAMGVSHLGMKYRVALCSLVYRKSLRLSTSIFGQTTVGQIVNLLSNDMNRFDFGTVLFNYLIISPMQMCIMIYFIWQMIGVSSIIGVGVLVALIPFQYWIGGKISTFRGQSAALTDKRVQLINEAVSGIQVIKMYSWESWFSQIVGIARQEEIDKIQHSSFLKGVNASFRMFNTRIAFFLSIMTYSVLGNELTSQKVFVTVCYYEIMKQTMTVWFPDAISSFKELLVTFHRFEEFLAKDEITRVSEKKFNASNNNMTSEASSTESEKLLDQNNKNEEVKVAIVFEKNGSSNIQQIPLETININDEISDTIMCFEDVSAKWNHKDIGDYALKNITFSIKSGSSVAITGEVGSGKSSIFYAILREMPCINGIIKCLGNISYASQVSWLFPGTIKENILFGAPLDQERYERVCQVCALEEDFNQFYNGDMTYVGDRGITLSGGQRGRINLARSVYRDADIYLLDDPLSAVDTKVAKHLIDECIMGLLRHKTVLLISHQLQYLNEFSHVITIKDGRIITNEMKSDHPMNKDFYKLCSVNSIDEDEQFDNNIPENKKIADKQIQSTKNAQIESMAVGKVKWNVYKAYIDSCGSKILLLFLFTLIIFTQFLASGFDYWTKYWASVEEKTNFEKINSFQSGGLFNFTNNSYSTNSSWLEGNESNVNIENPSNHTTYMFIFTGLATFLIVITLGRSLLFYRMAMNASFDFHEKMFHSISRSTMDFFHVNPVGRILNRFSQDIGTVDDLLPLLILEVLQISLQITGIMLIISVIEALLVIPIIVFGVLILFIRKCYIGPSRGIKRIEGIARSPVFSHLSSTMQGLVTIRALSAEDLVINKFDSLQDLYTSASHMFMGTSRAFAYVMDLACVIFMGIIIGVSFLKPEEIIGSNIGLAVTQVIGLTTMLQWGIRQVTELENKMICVERINEYTKIESESSLETSLDKKLEKSWPANGQIKFENVSLTYLQGDQPSLKGITFSIESKNRFGIVGRTGAGKTSIINSLFRLVNFDGLIEIDGVDITKVGLHLLRSKISIIPQEPVLFSGKLRTNLDPFNSFNDDVLWKALEQVNLKSLISELPNSLCCTILENGNNFSVGQRQLICLARALIHSNKIIVLDEATACVDNDTDAVIQTVIREKFTYCTVITIAHRMKTIMDSDKVIVMKSGEILEFDDPKILLQNKNSEFYKMLQKSDETI